MPIHSQDHQTRAAHTARSDSERADRNFDAIADHFENKVYGGLKGAIRLAVLRRDIFDYVDAQQNTLGRPLRILDVGAGLAQIAIELAAKGHRVVVNDISANMLAKAQNNAAAIPNAPDNITWHVCPYQALPEKLGAVAGTFDLILCHALLEWLAEPQAVMDFFDRQLRADGALSLCFYNPASFDYRNLMMGNFNVLDNKNFAADNKKSLTPNHPVAYSEVQTWIAKHHYQVKKSSGLRVFSDYVTQKRGGNEHPKEVIRMELRYSEQEPYKWMGRYLHLLLLRG